MDREPRRVAERRPHPLNLILPTMTNVRRRVCSASRGSSRSPASVHRSDASTFKGFSIMSHRIGICIVLTLFVLMAFAHPASRAADAAAPAGSQPAGDATLKVQSVRVVRATGDLQRKFSNRYGTDGNGVQ